CGSCVVSHESDQAFPLFHVGLECEDIDSSLGQGEEALPECSRSIGDRQRKFLAFCHTGKPPAASDTILALSGRSCTSNRWSPEMIKSRRTVRAPGKPEKTPRPSRTSATIPTIHHTHARIDQLGRV